MGPLADPAATKRAMTVRQLLALGLLRDMEGRRLVLLDNAEVEVRLKQRNFEEEK